MKLHHIVLLCHLFLLSIGGRAQSWHTLTLPRQEQLSSQQVLHVIQDSEGFLWYATEGGGVCRDDGRQITVFRSDAEHPDLLGSNDVASLAEAAGRYIIIGTFHGASVLDKHNYEIRRLQEVDDKRVDDIIVGRNGHWWLTANKKIYEYDADGQLLKVRPAGDKYILRLHEDRQGRLWATEWQGGLLRLDGEQFVQAPWPVDAAPTTIDDHPTVADGLLVGTFGRGVVTYLPATGSVEQEERQDSICMGHESTDHQGDLLVADGRGGCYALSHDGQQPWFSGQPLTRFTADSLRAAYSLSARPTAIARSDSGELWFSTGKDIRCLTQGEEQVVLPDVSDVSAMVFTADHTLWMATIFGTVMTYRDGKVATDEYASNEYGDAIVALQTDSAGRLVMVSDRYVRLYDTTRRTLRQQNVEDDGVYRIELQETQPGEHWSQPEKPVVERLPQWVWWLLAVMLVILCVLLGYIWFLHRQRNHFVEAMKKETPPVTSEQPAEEQPALSDEWLKKAISKVEHNIAEEHYSVEQLSSDMCMSRMTFYRKIQAATGQTPTEFMRTIRLRRAAEQLRQGEKSVTEISYATGFSSVSYFSRCFRAMYGVPPTQYGNMATGTNG